MSENKLLRMDNIGIVVESLDDAISFFTELGLKLEGRTMVDQSETGSERAHVQCVERSRAI